MRQHLLAHIVVEQQAAKDGQDLGETHATGLGGRGEKQIVERREIDLAGHPHRCGTGHQGKQAQRRGRLRRPLPERGIQTRRIDDLMGVQPQTITPFQGESDVVDGRQGALKESLARWVGGGSFSEAALIPEARREEKTGEGISRQRLPNFPKDRIVGQARARLPPVDGRLNQGL